MPDTEVDETAPSSEPPRSPVVLWVNDGPVCVSIAEEPVHEHMRGVCRCGGCRASLLADRALDFM